MMGLPGPADLLKLSTEAVKAVEQAIGLVPRIVALVAEIETIVHRVGPIVDAVESVQERAATAVGRVEQLQARVDQLLTRTGGLLDRYEPALDKLEPILTRLAETTSPDEVDAIVKLVDLLPNVVGKLDEDILPILDTLSTVAPDLRDLLDVSKELNELIGSVPGLGRVKRRIEEEREDASDTEEYRADEPPSSSPDRS
jgi:ABC-type transporter Mla subunit MlaD